MCEKGARSNFPNKFACNPISEPGRIETIGPFLTKTFKVCLPIKKRRQTKVHGIENKSKNFYTLICFLSSSTFIH